MDCFAEPVIGRAFGGHATLAHPTDCDVLICISGSDGHLSQPLMLATVAKPDFKNHLITGGRQWILGSKAAAPSCAHPARVWDAPARWRWLTKGCMSR